MSFDILGAGITLSVSTGTIVALAKYLLARKKRLGDIENRKSYVDKKLKKFWIKKFTIELEEIAKPIKKISELNKLTEKVDKAITDFKNGVK
ncbi:hypothetical protein KAR91_11300 [Candidatus Pacearchaeota archaeon]|nr:hypothetical protein [Candidatus Pacearchaeota archaeon]